MDQEEVWDSIAEQWHNFRQQKFKPVYDFLEKYKPKKGKILEIGCGNGRNLIPFAKKGFECYGVDFSQNMLAKAKEYVQKNNVNIRLLKADMLRLPFKDEEFDYVLSVASLHHVTDDKDIKKALSEMNRVLKRDGIMLLTVWNKLQLRFLFRRKNIQMPWKIGNNVYFRNVHLFDYFELKRSAVNAGFIVVEGNIFGRNLVFVLKKRWAALD